MANNNMKASVNNLFLRKPNEELKTKRNKKAAQKKLNRKRKRKFNRKNQIENYKKKFSLSMSAWAENFTIAATWQLKHQIAYWKSRAKALEYENAVLHEIIKKNYENASRNATNVQSEESENEDSENEDSEHEDRENSIEYDDGDDDDDEHFEVSEEYIQFLQENAKYKEDARRERERLKAKQEMDDNTKSLEAGPSETVENYEDDMKNLYGDKWQRISALEMSLQSDFIKECDSAKPRYWPNLAFNLKCD